MDLLNMGAELLQQKFGKDINVSTIKSALANLVGSGDGSLDLAALVCQMMGNSGLQDTVTSWLGDGGNAAISPQQITALFGADKIAGFAAQLGIGEFQAADGLADVLPVLVDKGSSGGALLDNAGGVKGILGLVKKFF